MSFQDGTGGASRAPARTRGAGIAGLVFVVLLIGGVFSGGGTPDNDAPDQEWLDWFADSGNRVAAVVGMFLVAASAVAFLVFVSGVAQRIRSGGGGDGAAALGWGAGIAYAAVLLVAAATINPAAVGIEIGEMTVPENVDVLRMAEQAGVATFVLGGWMAALAVGALSWAGRRADALPGWLATGGLVTAVLLVFSALWIPMVALPLWAIATSVVLLRGPAGGATPAAPVQTAPREAVPVG